MDLYASAVDINSRPWWDDYFQQQWDAHGGSDQTRYFMETILTHLPQSEQAYLSGGPVTILDWGCAFGEGVATLAGKFPGSRVAGLDFSQTAIDRARIRNSGYEFIWSEDGAIPRDFDAIVTSNCLEHFEQPLDILDKHLNACRNLYIVLVPYNECPLHPQHRAQFRVESFPVRVRDFTRIHVEPLAVNKRFWPGQQLLVIYASERYLSDTDRVDSMAPVIARLDAQRNAEQRRADAAEAERDAQRRRAETAEAERNAERRTSEAVRRRTWAGIQEFQAQLEKLLSSYRSQRAWRVMLAIRKAYTLLVLRKLEGQIAGGLDKFDLTFPNILSFVPEELRKGHAARGSRLSARGHKADRQYDIVVLPIFDFEFRFQRPQQIAAQFARAGHRVFWISPSRLLPSSSDKPYERIQIRENVWEIRLRATPFDLYRGAFEPSQATGLLDGLGRLYHDLDLASSCVILQFPFWRQIGLGLREKFGAKVVYDCMDDWQNWPTEPLPGRFSLLEEVKLVRESDILMVTSRELHDRHAADGIESMLIPNAADFQFFRDSPGGPPLDGVARPVIGYYGAIADWFDLELITQVARSRPQYSFVLIGQVHLLDVSELKALANTHLLGEKPYSELPGYLRQFDVCTLPFRMNRLTRAVDPVKVYEYLSQGKPVVSAPLPELNPLSDLLYFAQGPEEFAGQIDRALAECNAALRQKRIDFASENTWAERVGTLDRAIRAKFPLVSILVVTYNTREFLQPFFDSIRRNTSYPSYEVIVVDNHSSDGSAQELQRYASADPRIRIDCLQQNLGFAGGNNLAARMAKGEYLVLLNPDTILTEGWLERLIRPLETDSAVGLVAPVTNFSGNETKVNTSYRSLDEMEEFAAECAQLNRGDTLTIEVVPLFCGLLRRKVWDEVGGLDEDFKIGTFEDDDFSLRVRNAGYRIVTAEDCFIHHFGNGSFGKMESEAFVRIFAQNKRCFESKWNMAWRPHTTRPGVKPISEDSRIAVSEFFDVNDGSE